VVRAEVQVVEDVELARYLYVVEDLEAERREGVIQIVRHLRDGVQAAESRRGARTRHIEACRQCVRCIEQELFTRSTGRRELVSQLVRVRADDPSLVRREVLEHSEHSRELSLLAEHACAHFVQSLD
jgi:hypothetical protein